MTPHRSYRHEAVCYRGDEDFVAGNAPFVQEGLRLGQPVMVAVVPERLALLRAALGGDAHAVHWVDMARLGANPARIIPAWRQFVDEHAVGDQPVRGIGEPIWAGRRPAEVVECQLHEALLNLAVDPDTPLWLRCPYDVDALDAEVVDEAARSHPVIVDGDDYNGSRRYGGADHAGSMLQQQLPQPTADVEEILFEHGGVEDVRHRVLERAAVAGLNPARSFDLGVAVAEAVTNSVRHGGGRGALRMWEDDGALVCEIRDSGHITDPLAGRRPAPLTDEGGRGLWMINQLSDLVQLRSAADGTSLRILSWL